MRCLAFFAGRRAMPLQGEVICGPIFDEFYVKGPGAWTLPPFSVAALLECTPSEGTRHVLTLHVVDADENEIHPVLTLEDPPFSTNRDGRPLRSVGFFDVPGLYVPGPGDYRLLLRVDDTPVADFPFYVLEDQATNI